MSPFSSPHYTILEGVDMCARGANTYQNHDCIIVDIKESGLAAERACTLGRPGSRQADKRYKSILTVWGLAVAGTPTISKLRQTKKSKSSKPTQHSPDTNQICVADLLCTALVSVKEKIWHWYLLRRVAVCLEPCASLPGIEFGVQSLRQFARTKATTVM
jgi:hypothetical protein